MKRTGFSSKVPERRPAKQYLGENPSAPRAVPLRIHDGKARMVVSVPKRIYLRSTSYRRYVASLPCEHCGIVGRSQAAHSDAGADGKGLQIKSDDSEIFAACADAEGRVGCHVLLCSNGKFKREHAQAIVAKHIRTTQERAIAAGKWPMDWPVPKGLE